MFGIGFGGFKNARVDGTIAGPEDNIPAVGLALKSAVDQHAPVGADRLAIQGASAAWKPRPFLQGVSIQGASRFPALIPAFR